MNVTAKRLSAVKVKRLVRKRDGYRCTECGMTTQEHLERYDRLLDVHRIVPGSPYTVEGCVALCRGCHGNKPKCQPGENDQCRLAFHLPQKMYDAFKRYLDGQEIRPNESEILRAALRRWMESVGIWPPAP